MKTYRPHAPMLGFVIGLNRNDRFNVRFAGASDPQFEGMTVLNTAMTAAAAARVAWQIPDYVGHELHADAVIAPLSRDELNCFREPDLDPTFEENGFIIFPASTEDLRRFLN